MPMSGEAWSCFEQLPSGLIEQTSAPLTLNWLRPRPTHAGFNLTPWEVSGRLYARVVALQRGALVILGLLVVGLVAGLNAAGETQPLADLSSIYAIWGIVVAAIAGATVFLTAIAIIRYQRAEPKRQSFQAASVEFEQIAAWRQIRCRRSYWSDDLDPAGFERECAELLAGAYSTGQVALTRPTNDYGVDILMCTPNAGRMVVQCKQWDRKIGAAQVRELAGVKTFFGADQAILIALEKPSEDNEQCNILAQRLNLQFWDTNSLVAWAERLSSR